MTEEDRFLAKVEPAPDGCWLWSAAINGGYPLFWHTPEGDDRPSPGAHRYAYRRFVGPIPPLYDIHHRCHQALCVNPAHLEAISRRDHQLKTPNTYTWRAAQYVSDPSELRPWRPKDTPWGRQGRARESVLTRFWRYIEISADGCWEWTGFIKSGGLGEGGGYGSFGVNGRSRYPHRIAYELFRGKIPKGTQVDHLCRNRKCCNPDHLEPVTPSVNQRRGANCGKTHCPQGHEFTAENSRRAKSGTLLCRECHRICQRRINARNRGKPLPLAAAGVAS